MSKKIFLTSSPFVEPRKPFNCKNKFVEKLSESLKNKKNALFITSDPWDISFTESFSLAVKETLKLTGIHFENYTILDYRNSFLVEDFINQSDFIILSGGHVPTQNNFFKKLNLRGLIQNFSGVVLGISAGSMNAADVVYAQPEEEGESVDLSYQRFLEGLNLTKKMIIPHYQDIKNKIIDGKRLFEDVTYKDSIGKEFYAFPDGTYLYSCRGKEEIFGEYFKIKDGEIEKVSNKTIG